MRVLEFVIRIIVLTSSGVFSNKTSKSVRLFQRNKKIVDNYSKKE